MDTENVSSEVVETPSDSIESNEGSPVTPEVHQYITYMLPQTTESTYLFVIFNADNVNVSVISFNIGVVLCVVDEVISDPLRFAFAVVNSSSKSSNGYLLKYFIL